MVVVLPRRSYRVHVSTGNVFLFLPGASSVPSITVVVIVPLHASDVSPASCACA